MTRDHGRKAEEATDEAGQREQDEVEDGDVQQRPTGEADSPDADPGDVREVAPSEEAEVSPSEERREDEDPVRVLQAELERLRDQHLRLAADFENYRKRANAELAGAWNRARADLVGSLLDGLDDLQRVSEFTTQDTTVEALVEGVDLVERKIFKALTEAGLEVLEPVGDRFDPNTMEAMMRVDVEEEGQDETVHQVFQKGYLFKDQLVRPARVSVYKDED